MHCCSNFFFLPLLHSPLLVFVILRRMSLSTFPYFPIVVLRIDSQSERHNLNKNFMLECSSLLLFWGINFVYVECLANKSSKKSLSNKMWINVNIQSCQSDLRAFDVKFLSQHLSCLRCFSSSKENKFWRFDWETLVFQEAVHRHLELHDQRRKLAHNWTHHLCMKIVTNEKSSPFMHASVSRNPFRFHKNGDERSGNVNYPWITTTTTFIVFIIQYANYVFSLSSHFPVLLLAHCETESDIVFHNCRKSGASLN